MNAKLKKLLRDQGLSLCLLLLFAGTFLGQSIAGHRQHSQAQREHGQPAISYTSYLTTPDFIEATFENWESEFLQMALYVWLTSFLFQRGSAESKDPDSPDDASDEDPQKHQNDPDAPYPVRKQGFLLVLYERSLVLALLVLFLISFGLHFAGSVRQSCEEQLLHGQTCESAMQQLFGSKFWFESLQNWQSEFFSIAALVILSIFLRQRGSPESKPVHAPHSATGKG